MKSITWILLPTHDLALKGCFKRNKRPVGRRSVSSHPQGREQALDALTQHAGHDRAIRVPSFTYVAGSHMNEDAVRETTTDLGAILQRRAPDIDWLMVHGQVDHEATLWIRVRAMRAERQVQFVVIVPAADKVDNNTLAARIITEVLRLLSKHH